MFNRLTTSFIGSEKPDVCQKVGQFLAMPATVLCGRTIQVLGKGHMSEKKTATWQKVLAVALTILLFPLIALTTPLGLFLNSCSVTHQNAYRRLVKWEKGTTSHAGDTHKRARSQSVPTDRRGNLASPLSPEQRRERVQWGLPGPKTLLKLDRAFNMALQRERVAAQRVALAEAELRAAGGNPETIRSEMGVSTNRSRSAPPPTIDTSLAKSPSSSTASPENQSGAQSASGNSSDSSYVDIDTATAAYVGTMRVGENAPGGNGLAQALSSVSKHS